MPKTVRPLLKVLRTKTGSTLFHAETEHGSLESEIDGRHRDTLVCAYGQTQPDYRRQGTLSALITSSIKGAYAIENAKLQKARFPIINPVVVPLLGKIFDGSVAWYAEEEDFRTESNGIDMATAQALAASREEQAEMFRAAHMEFPDDFDPGVHAVAALEPAKLAEWVMPNIIFVDRLF